MNAAHVFMIFRYTKLTYPYTHMCTGCCCYFCLCCCWCCLCTCAFVSLLHCLCIGEFVCFYVCITSMYGCWCVCVCVYMAIRWPKKKKNQLNEEKEEEEDKRKSIVKSFFPPSIFAFVFVRLASILFSSLICSFFRLLPIQILFYGDDSLLLHDGKLTQATININVR